MLVAVNLNKYCYSLQNFMACGTDDSHNGDADN